MTEDLAARLLAAIDHTERTAREALAPAGPTVDVTVNGQPQLPASNPNRTAYSAETLRYLVAQQPDAVLRRCAADRKILARHDPYGDEHRKCTWCGEDSPCPDVRDLAEGYGITEETA